jgi:hypothetical protein
MRSLRCLAAIAACVLSSCAKPDVDVRFDPAAAAFINQPGKGKIEGHAFFRGENGRVVFAAGEYVDLIPSTPYSDARFQAFFGERKYLRATRIFLTMEADPDYKKYARTTKAESDGRFTFENVAPGTYYVWTQATWVPENGILPMGGIIYEKVTLTGKEEAAVKVIVSGK